MNSRLDSNWLQLSHKINLYNKKRRDACLKIPKLHIMEKSGDIDSYVDATICQNMLKKVHKQIITLITFKKWI
jgi:hypothetical protein